MTAQLLRVAAVYERDPGQAKDLLHDVNACPIHLRDTTWRFYERCCSRWELATFPGHTSDVTSVAFSADGLTLASGSLDSTVRLWDVKTGQPRATLQGHTISVQSVAFSPDGLTLVPRPKGQLQITGTHQEQSVLGWTTLSLTWNVVDLWRLSAADLLAANDVGLIPWVPLAQQDGPPETLIRQCREHIDQQARAEERENLIAVTQVFTQLRYNRVVAQQGPNSS